ncbi:MAG: hypothetical protein DRI79_02295 [Chloroflexi bacterium]|nr:MAG: hypothetical protein DRI79_02295 [Chloroflexota bacterium]HEY67211.1 hypothetical protein [Thermoflexia bacterium]
MNTTVLQDPLFLVVLGFGLAMAVVVVLLVLTRASHYPSPGYTPPPAAYSSESPGDRLDAGCILFPLLIAGIAVLLALLS